MSITTEFIDQIAPIIQEESRKRNYKVCSTAIAQAIIESANGRSSLAKKYYNYFGMKCGSVWMLLNKPSVNLKTKEEYQKGVLTSITDYFRVYKNMREGVIGYYEFINTKRYAQLKEASTYKEYSYILKKAGYATSSSYINTLNNTVEKYDLTRFDLMPYSINGHFPTLKKGSKNDYVKLLQVALNKEGYALLVDGDFGSKTQIAVIGYQGEKGLVKDGIVGAKTWGALGY